MKSTGVVSDGVVHQVLNKENYKRWKIVMQNYLEGQDLWDGVIQNSNNYGTDQVSKKDGKAILNFFQPSSSNHVPNPNIPDPNYMEEEGQGQGCGGRILGFSEYPYNKSLKTRDAKALHAIQLSCGREILDEISHLQNAKGAWNHLRSQYGNDLTASADILQDVLLMDDNHSSEYKEIFWKIERGDFIGDTGGDFNPYDVTSASTRSTLLHVAVIVGNVKNVEKLVNDCNGTLVCMQDQYGDTALSLVARYTGNIDIAKCMVEEIDDHYQNELLKKTNNDGVIPIHLAAANGHKKLTTYLYSKTPKDVFENLKNRVLLFSLCIMAEIFDVALKLLERFKHLPDESYNNFTDHKLLKRRESFLLPNQSSLRESSSPDKFSVLIELAKMHSAFPSGTRFGFLKQIIYNNLNLDRKFKEDYGISDITNFVRNVTSVKTSSEGLESWSIFPKLAYWQPLKHIYGTSEIYDKKCTHYQVIRILSYFSRSVANLNDLELKNASAYEAMLHAAEHGIIEFINAMREAKPALLSAVNSYNRGIFSYAIQYRKQNVFQLIHGLRGRKEMYGYCIDKFGNNMLHLAAHLGPPSDRYTRSGAALQMQREIQWFKAVEKVLHPKFKEAENDDGKKPYEIFTENHEELVKAGEKWAKDTATSYIIVGTLIITIMFAAAFTVPGGNDQTTGLPVFLHGNVFSTFLIADALSLFTSATSVLVFIGILTSRFTEKDFLKNLPWKLLFGFLFLFLSVCSMIVAFCAAIVDMISRGYRNHKWSILPFIMLFGIIPIITILVSQLRLMKEIIHSTWKNRISTIEG